jgi:hypothetical protein
VSSPGSALVTHCGARTINREELDEIEAPPPTKTWFPVKHSSVIDTVACALNAVGFEIRRLRFAVARRDARMFATMDLETSLGSGVSLAVGIRNSTDKSLPLGFCAGSRVFVCDNLAFRSELLVHRKHTRFGEERFREGICEAVKSLEQFRSTEAERIERMRGTEIGDEIAESLMLRGHLAGIVSPRLLPGLVKEWRYPVHEEFCPRTVWSLFNAFTAVLAPRQKSNPQQFAALTIRLSEMLDPVQGPSIDGDEHRDAPALELAPVGAA